MKRPFVLKTKNVKSPSIKNEAVNLKNMEENLAEKIKFSKIIQSKYKKLIACEEKRQKLEEELNEAIKNYEKEVMITRHESSEEFVKVIKNIIGQV